MVKDKDEQPDKEIPRVRYGRVPSAGRLSPWSRLCHQWGCVHQLGSSPTEILWRLPHIGAINCQLHFQPFSPVWNMKSEAENS